MKERRVVLALTLSFVLVGSSARADPFFFSRTLEAGIGYCCAPFPTSVEIPLGIYRIGPGLLSPVFDALPLTPVDIGATFFASAASDPDFLTLVSVLTNGVNDSIGLALRAHPGAAGGINAPDELTFFEGLTPVRSGPDLAGYQVSRITLTIHDLRFSPFVDPEAGGGTIYARYTYGFEGEAPPIPEPATVSLLATGLVALAVRRRAGLLLVLCRFTAKHSRGKEWV